MGNKPPDAKDTAWAVYQQAQDEFGRRKQTFHSVECGAAELDKLVELIELDKLNALTPKGVKSTKKRARADRARRMKVTEKDLARRAREVSPSKAAHNCSISESCSEVTRAWLQAQNAETQLLTVCGMTYDEIAAQKQSTRDRVRHLHAKKQAALSRNAREFPKFAEDYLVVTKGMDLMTVAAILDRLPDP
ncbi:MAG: hypothetical protein IAG10_24610 [Planctomycetaceae bacterium]|nr:hypothetical protein [Planctomycetaceae bacterium]